MHLNKDNGSFNSFLMNPDKEIAELASKAQAVYAEETEYAEKLALEKSKN
mgnify:CR=1 FL=1